MKKNQVIKQSLHATAFRQRYSTLFYFLKNFIHYFIFPIYFPKNTTHKPSTLNYFISAVSCPRECKLN